MFGPSHDALCSGEVTVVDINNAQFQSFDQNPRAIGTFGLRGCSVVLIASRRAAILAHIASSELISVMDQVANLYWEKRHAYFPDNNNVWVVTATVVDDGNFQPAIDSQRRIMETKLGDLGLHTTTSPSYSISINSGGNSPEFRDKGTVFVDARTNELMIWVEDRLLHKEPL